jgi:hypothetical protein
LVLFVHCTVHNSKFVPGMIARKNYEQEQRSPHLSTHRTAASRQHLMALLQLLDRLSRPPPLADPPGHNDPPPANHSSYWRRAATGVRRRRWRGRRLRRRGRRQRDGSCDGSCKGYGMVEVVNEPSAYEDSIVVKKVYHKPGHKA